MKISNRIVHFTIVIVVGIIAILWYLVVSKSDLSSVIFQTDESQLILIGDENRENGVLIEGQNEEVSSDYFMNITGQPIAKIETDDFIVLQGVDYLMIIDSSIAHKVNQINLSVEDHQFPIVTNSSNIGASFILTIPPSIPVGGGYQIELVFENEDRLKLDQQYMVRAMGTIWPFHFIANMDGGPDGARFYPDLNNPEIVVSAFEQSDRVFAFRNPGPENIQEEWDRIEIAQVERGEDAILWDMDNDGIMDVISAHEGDELKIYVHWGTDASQSVLGNNFLTEEIPSANGKSWLMLAIADIDGDGLEDLVAGAKDDLFNNRNSVGSIAWLKAPNENRRDLTTWTYTEIDYVGWPMSVIPYDVDGDGDFDIIVSDQASDANHQGVRWLENRLNEEILVWKAHFVPGTRGLIPRFMQFYDLDNDNIEDLFITEESATQVIISKRDIDEKGATFFSPDPVYISLPHAGSEYENINFGIPKGIGVGDLDNDGQVEIVVSLVNGNVALGYLSLFGEDPFTENWNWETLLTISEPKLDTIQLIDLDHDKDLDIASTEEVAIQGIFWLENPFIQNFD
jgi:hypothetical protein